nr:hypothetical protein [Tanacetum cinerariifolium]
MKCGFLSQKRSGGRRGVKEKNKDVAAKNGVSPSVTNKTLVKDPTTEIDKLYSLDDTTVLGSFPPLSTLVTTTASNTADSIPAISKCFANTAYGFFLEKKVAYPIVANYVRNT